MVLVNRLVKALLILAMLIGPVAPASADLRAAPGWYDQNAVSLAPDWHYRVPVNIPAGATVNATIRVDVDFAALLAQLGVAGNFDANSPRIVRASGALATRQEFTDSVFAGSTNAAGDSRGEIRFLLEDAGPATYYLYFDITQNGAKPANPQVPINGNFEFGSAGTATPPGWTTSSKVDPAFDAEIRASESPSITSDSATLNNPMTTDGTPRTGAQSYLIGARTNNEPVSNKNATLLDRTITIPASSPGDLTIRWRPEGWDSDVDGGVNGFDHFKVSIITAGGAVTQIIGPAAGNYVTAPYAPAYGLSAIATTTPGYGAYNSWDMGTGGAHTLAMAVGYNASPWWSKNYALAAFAGQTVTLRIETGHIVSFRTWASVDDVEWSVVSATLGAPQGFGVNITSPAAATSVVPGQAMPIAVTIDALPGAATTPMTAAIFNAAGTLLAGGFLLYNDGTHGDAVAGDAIWSNNNSVPAQPAPTVPVSAPIATNYVLRVFARDASTSSLGAQNGLIRGPGSGAATETQANFWNIDEILFNIASAAISFTKVSMPISDPVNGTTNPKAIPGATVQYCLLISNAGPLTATNIVVTDTLPATLTYVAGSMRSGASCAAAATLEDDDNSGADESDPFGASQSSGTIIAVTASMINGAVAALVFNTLIQ